MTQPESGEIFVAGEPVRFRHNRDAIRHGIGYVSEDRLTQGLIMEQSIYDNTIVSVLTNYTPAVACWITARPPHW